MRLVSLPQNDAINPQPCKPGVYVLAPAMIHRAAPAEAVRTTDELFSFWSQLQRCDCDLSHINSHWIVFKLMRRWPK